MHLIKWTALYMQQIGIFSKDKYNILKEFAENELQSKHIEYSIVSEDEDNVVFNVQNDRSIGVSVALYQYIDKNSATNKTKETESSVSIFNKYNRFTLFVILLCIAMYYLEIVYQESFISVFKIESKEGVTFITEPWRLLTPALMHGGFSHIFLNLLFWYEYGTIIERRIGIKTLISVSIFTAICSALGQYYITGPDFVGLSGVLMGLISFLWIYERNNDNIEQKSGNGILFFAIIWIALGYSGAIPIAFANEAHLFGFLSGFVAGMYFKVKHKSL